MKSQIQSQIPLTKQSTNSQRQFFNVVSYVFLLVFAVSLVAIVNSSLQDVPFKLHIMNFYATTTAAIPSPTSPPITVEQKLEDLKKLDKFLKVPDVNHTMGDEELLFRASKMPKINEFPINIVPKVAFMFLTKGPVYMAPFWEMFFKGHEGLYSIYIHSYPGYNESSFDQGPVFQGRQIRSKPVAWGQVNMVEAERRLLGNALLDVANQWFVLVSEACIPLFDFTTVYNHLMNSKQNFVEMYDLDSGVARGRYKEEMAPEVKLDQWRKGSQWFQINRDLATAIVADNKYFPIFFEYCRNNCYADEHYIPTFVNILSPEANSNRTLTWVDWTYGGPHPTRYTRNHVTYEFVNFLRGGNTCQYNGENTTTCYLFARKFLPNALDRLVRFGPKLFRLS